MSDTLTLQYGANQYVIPGLRAAWGCRLIVRQDGDVDFVPDRQSGAVLDPDNADHQRLLDATMEWVRTGAADGAFKNISKCLREGVMQTRERQGVWVFEDEHGIVLANTNASAGYCYVVGWIFDALPVGHRTKGADLLVEEIKRAASEDGKDVA